MKKEDAIVLDCDDTIVKYTDGLREYIIKYYDFNPVGYPSDYILSEWIGCTDDETIEILENFNYHSHEFGLLEPIDFYVRSALLELHNRGIKLIILSKCGNKGHATVLRKVNLQYVFGDIFHEFILIDPLESKKYYLRKLKETYNILAFIDDNSDNVQIGLKMGLETIMYNREHNYKYQGESYAFKNWLTIMEHLEKNIIK